MQWSGGRITGLNNSRMILILKGLKWLISREMGLRTPCDGAELLDLISMEIEEAEREAGITFSTRPTEKAPVYEGKLKTGE